MRDVARPAASTRDMTGNLTDCCDLLGTGAGDGYGRDASKLPTHVDLSATPAQKVTVAPTFSPLTLPALAGCLSVPALVGANQILTESGFLGAALGASALLLTS